MSHAKKASLGPAWSAFFEELKLAAEEISDDEALDAAKRLSKKKTLGRYAKTTGVMTVAYPLVAAAGEGVKGLIQGGRAGAMQGVTKQLTGGDLGKNVTRGALSGSAIQAVREMIDRGEDQKTVKRYVQEHSNGR